jgi:hypothetical protein
LQNQKKILQNIKFYKTLFHEVPLENYQARLLTSGIRPVFYLPVFTVASEKTDFSGYSGGTVTEFHRVPFAMITLKTHGRSIKN